MEILLKTMSALLTVFGFLFILFALVIHIANNAKGYYGTIFHWPSLLGCSVAAILCFYLSYTLWR